MKPILFAPLTALLLACAAAPAQSATDTAAPGQKLDSGLGALPHYSLWVDPKGRYPTAVAVAGESLDNGLGELPHYSQWKDPRGRDPLGHGDSAVAIATR